MLINQIKGVDQIETPISPEKVGETPEQSNFISPEFSSTEATESSRAEIAPVSAPTDGQSIDSVQSVNTQIDERFSEIENILEDDLGDIYFSLSPTKQQEFKIKGEETTSKILNLLTKPKVKAKKIVTLIKEWLSIVPGVNKFFLEQTAKIKADKIIGSTYQKN